MDGKWVESQQCQDDSWNDNLKEGDEIQWPESDYSNDIMINGSGVEILNLELFRLIHLKNIK